MYCGTSVDKNGIIKNAIKALCAKVKIFAGCMYEYAVFTEEMLRQVNKYT